MFATALKNIFTEDKNKIVNLPIGMIKANPNQPRSSFDNEALCELALSIRQYGVIQPISVRRTNDYYELIAGERRLRASKLAGCIEIPAIILDVDDDKSALLALIENLQREDLCYFEEAQAFQRLISQHAMTQDELGKKLGKSQSTIANKMRLLKLNNSVRDIINENRLTERHSRSLLRIADEKIQLDTVKYIVEHNLNVEQTEALIDNLLNDNKKPLKNKPMPIIKDIRLFSNAVRQAIQMIKKNGVKANMTQTEFEWGIEYTIKVENPRNLSIQN